MSKRYVERKLLDITLSVDWLLLHEGFVAFPVLHEEMHMAPLKRFSIKSVFRYYDIYVIHK